MSIQLREYQKKFISDIRNEFRKNNKHVVGVAPCGAGKTIMTGWMIRQALQLGKRAIFFVHRQELIKQTSETFNKLGIEHGIICAGVSEQLSLPVQIASVQTLARRLDKVPTPDLLICDECHHILANTYKKIIDKWHDAFLLGVTATPLRMGGKTLCDVFDSMVLAPSVNHLIQLGNLTRFQYVAATIKDINLDDVRIHNGDFDTADLNKIMSNTKITGDIVDNYREFANGKSAICYCVNVNHSQTVAQAFLDSGISAAHIDGETPTNIRAQIVDDFRNNKITVLCNAELFGEGFDVPKCQAAILARPTKSLTLFIQQAMRPMRPDPDDPDKVAVIIDCVQNCERHGLPNDFRQWSLDPNDFAFKKCPSCGNYIVPAVFTKKPDVKFIYEKKNGCFFLKKVFAKDGEPVKLGIIYDKDVPVDIIEDDTGQFLKICPDCGFLFLTKAPPKTAPPQPKFQDGELDLVDVSFTVETEHTGIIRKPTTPEDFLKIAQKKNYKNGWVAHCSLKYAKSIEDCQHIARVLGYKKGWAWHQWQELQSSKNS